MNLWTAKHDVIYDEEQVAIAAGVVPAKAQQIANEHNAWVIAASRNWSVKRWASGLYGVINGYGDCPHTLLGYADNAQPTPVAAILAADAWLKAREQQPT